MSRLFALIALLLIAVPVFAQQDEPGQGGQDVYIVVAPDVYERARGVYDAGDYQRAIVDFSLFILLNPTFSEGYYWRGLSHFQSDNLDSALADLTRALDFPSPSPEYTGQIYADRSLVYLEQENMEAALADLDAGIEAAPDFARLYYQRAQLHRFEARYDQAVADYSRVIELAPEFPLAYDERAAVYLELGSLDEALADYNRLIELDPENGLAYARRGLLHVSEARFENALADFNQAVRLTPDNPALYLQRGAIHQALGNTDEGAADYFQWIQAVQSEQVDLDALVPGESQVVMMEQGLRFNLPFTASMGQTATLTASARPGQTTDPLIVLLGVDGLPLAADDDGGGNYDSAIEDYLIPADGVYTLVVSHALGGFDGPVRIQLQLGE